MSTFSVDLLCAEEVDPLTLPDEQILDTFGVIETVDEFRECLVNGIIVEGDVACSGLLHL